MLLIRALQPFVLVRFGSLISSRIGHFVPDGTEHIARLQQQPTNTVDWFWLGKTCNKQWDRMMRRSLPVHAWVKYLDQWNRALPGGSAHERPSSYTDSRDVEGLYARHDVKIPFLPTESDEALTWLRSKGWSDGEPFVCLLVRDDEYLAQDSLHGNGNPRAYGGWSYHNFRNSDINTYLPAIQWLAKQGVWVIRMGKMMAKPLPTGVDHVIDYAFDSGKSDLLDIWLFANCTGCISTATGPDQISLIYERPALFVNASPLSLSFSWAHSLWVPKTMRWVLTGQNLSISEYLVNGWESTGEYDVAGIEVVDLTANEITSAVQEFWHRYSNSWKDTEDDQRRQEAYRKIFSEWPGFSQYNGWLHPQARVGTQWLRSVPVC
ncbi:TIGR04372 family glycosyltransferase [Actinomycetota bacterium]|nr:TIGR04372 family glycosyltransferase [Actinomycetota bacterium]